MGWKTVRGNAANQEGTVSAVFHKDKPDGDKLLLPKVVVEDITVEGRNRVAVELRDSDSDEVSRSFCFCCLTLDYIITLLFGVYESA